MKILGPTSLLPLGLLSAGALFGGIPQDNVRVTEKPNVLIILLDDVGFGQLSPFGGTYRMPNLDRLAAKGLRYTNFHTTALCSPTRAALLTGRNHHSVGMGTITESASQEPGYNGRIPKSAGTLAAMLKANGYDTYAVGKWHLTPAEETGREGPFDRWPTSMGFDHWYGWQGADTDQWSPALWSDTTPLEPPHGDKSYFLTNDLANHAIEFIDSQKDSGKPFFMYFATGAGHAPHHAPKEWIEKNKGRFDEGWNAIRDKVLAKQKELGIVPKDAELPPLNSDIKAWDSLTLAEKTLFTRMQEIHAGFVEQADFEIGRVLDALEKSGQMDNTMIVFTSDNGASGEGGLIGTTNEFRGSLPETVPGILARIDELGGPTMYNHYPAGWAEAGNTPFRYWKQETHEGGVHDPMIISWPARIKDGGAIRTQFQHVTDITPTVLEALAIKAPSTLNDVEQMPIEGTSMMNTFDSASAPTAKKVQYFEMMGNRGIWADGWKAVAFHGRMPWQSGKLNLEPYDQDRWELYNVSLDPTESKDLSAEYPDKLKELQSLFDSEAQKHQVYPLNDQGLGERVTELYSSFTAGLTSFSFDGPKNRVPEALAPWVKAATHTITADLDIPTGGASGAIVAQGGRFGGYSFYMKDQKLYYTYNFVGDYIETLESSEPVPEGKVTVSFQFELMPLGPDYTRGMGSLFINGKKVAEKMIAVTNPGPFGFLDSFDIGSDTVTPVAPDLYGSPYAFTGTITNVRFNIEKPTQTPNTSPAPAID